MMTYFKLVTISLYVLTCLNSFIKEQECGSLKEELNSSYNTLTQLHEQIEDLQSSQEPRHVSKMCTLVHVLLFIAVPNGA